MVTADQRGGNLSLSLTFPETRQQIRVVGTLDRLEWVAKDVCDVLGLTNVTEAMRGLDPDERHGQVNAYRIDIVEEYFAAQQA